MPRPSPVAATMRDDARSVATSPSPAFARELDRRRAAWIQQRSSQEENKMTPERVRKMEMSRLELASLCEESAAVAMGLDESDKAKLRQALTEFRDATLFRIEHPVEADKPKDDRPQIDAYGKRQRELLGDSRYTAFSRLEQQEREKLIAARRAFRKTGADDGSTGSRPSGSPPVPSAAP